MRRSGSFQKLKQGDRRSKDAACRKVFFFAKLTQSGYMSEVHLKHLYSLLHNFVNHWCAFAMRINFTIPTKHASLPEKYTAQSIPIECRSVFICQ